MNNLGLRWEQISYKDNAHVLELVEGKIGAPLGIMAVLNEECMLPKGTDNNMLGKLKKICGNHQSFSVNPRVQTDFIVAHYAGKVSYNVNGFVEKNRDTLPNECRVLLSGSSNKILAEVHRTVLSLIAITYVGSESIFIIFNHVFKNDF